MKYSIFINPKSPNSSASEQAFKFTQAIRRGKYEHISIFFYGYAVESAFFNDSPWKSFNHHDISLLACSTIAQDFQQNKKVRSNFTVAGLGQWMESTLNADKRIEFI
jgi:sulfur relay (sulfurtransferase) complex TusBCD TusD component (DsrE family)